jgi:hypothetical protein
MASTKTEPSTNDLSAKEIQTAQTEGVKKAITDSVAEGFTAIDGSLPGEPVDQFRYHGAEESQQWAHNLDLGVDAFEEAVTGKDSTIPDEKVYGLLALERNGRNRTPYVKVMMKRLGLKADELPGGGPSYTNDMTSITDL